MKKTPLGDKLEAAYQECNDQDEDAALQRRSVKDTVQQRNENDNTCATYEQIETYLKQVRIEQIMKVFGDYI